MFATKPQELNFLRILREKKKLREWIIAHQTSVKLWTTFLSSVLVFYHLFSDGDFSFLLTCSSMISMFSFVMVLVKIELNRSVAGISLKMYQAYSILLLARLFSIVPFEGYLPFDRSGDWLYQTCEILSFLLSTGIVYMCRYRYKHTYDPTSDIIRTTYLAVPMVLLAIVFHPTLNAFTPSDISWTFALYLESVASLPQLFKFQKEKKIKSFTSHFLAAQTLSKMLSFIFWLSSYEELNDNQHPRRSYVGYWVMAMQIVQLVMMGDFFYFYLKFFSNGATHINNIIIDDV